MHPPRPAKCSSLVLAGGLKKPGSGDDIRQFSGDIDTNLGGNIGGLLELSHVCRMWRRIAIRIYGDQGTLGLLPDHANTIVRELLSQSSSVPLHITVHGSRQRVDPLPVFELLKDPRISVLVVSLTIYEHRRNAVRDVWIDHLNECNFEHLRVLKIEGSDADHETSHRGGRARYTRMTGKMPNLSSVTLIDVFPIFDNVQFINLSISARTKLYKNISCYVVYVSLLLEWLKDHHKSLQTLTIEYPGFCSWEGYQLNEFPNCRMPFPSLKALEYEERVEQPYTLYDTTVSDSSEDDDEFEEEPGNGRTPRISVNDFFRHVRYGDETRVTLRLWFSSRRSLLNLGNILNALHDAGTPTPYGLRVKICSKQKLSFTFYKEPDEIHQYGEDTQAFFSAVFNPILQRCEIVISNDRGIDNFCIIRLASRKLHVSALRVVSDNPSDLVKIERYFDSSVRSRSQWSYALVLPPEGQSEWPGSDDGGLFEDNELPTDSDVSEDYL